jgi:hypothetical protein
VILCGTLSSVLSPSSPLRSGFDPHSDTEGDPLDTSCDHDMYCCKFSVFDSSTSQRRLTQGTFPPPRDTFFLSSTVFWFFFYVIGCLFSLSSQVPSFTVEAPGLGQWFSPPHRHCSVVIAVRVSVCRLCASPPGTSHFTPSGKDQVFVIFDSTSPLCHTGVLALEGGAGSSFAWKTIPPTSPFRSEDMAELPV